MPSYLVSSASRTTGGTFILDSKTGRTRRLLRGGSRGITRGPDGAYYVVSGTRNPEDQFSSIHRLDPHSWACELVTQLPLIDCHDFRWIDDAFYLVASLGNQIVRLNADLSMRDRFQVVQDDRDICHVNCLMTAPDGLYCSIFTLTPGERAEKRLTGAWHTEGKILRVHWETGAFDVLFEPLAQPHSLVPHAGQIYLLESHRSCLTRVDLGGGVSQVIAHYRGFLRGLHISESEALMGVCVLYPADRRRLKALPRLRLWLERRFPFAGVLVLDPRTWRVRKRIVMEEAEVYDIVPIPEGA